MCIVNILFFYDARDDDHLPLNITQGKHRSYYFTLRVLQYASQDKKHVVAEGSAFQIVKYYDSKGDNPPSPVLKYDVTEI